jgi:flagellar hook assembly protein FlgD
VSSTPPTGVPARYALYENAPNPLNPTTTIRYDVPAAGERVSILVFDVSGRKVRTLVDDVHEAGSKSVVWNGRDDRGQPAASGVYFYRMRAGSFMQTRKMVLLK